MVTLSKGFCFVAMRPYKGKFVSKTKRVFNYLLCHARQFVECTSRIPSNKLGIFHQALDDVAVSTTKENL